MHLFNKYCSALGANSCIKLLVFLDFYTFFAFFCPILGKFGKISVWFDYRENTFACQVIYTFFYKFFLKMFYFSLLRCFLFFTRTPTPKISATQGGRAKRRYFAARANPRRSSAFPYLHSKTTPRKSLALLGRCLQFDFLS